MGVIHKLKEEVIDFIVQQKKEIPSLSCRQLSILASQKFQKEISKSSINNILKGSQLSSPVGRRSFGEKKVKRFQIPVEKKKELENKLPIKTEEPLPTFKMIPRQNGISSIDEKATTASTQRLEAKDQEGWGGVDPARQEFLTEVDRIRYQDRQKKGLLFDHLGILLFKLTAWNLSNKPLLGSLLVKFRENIFSSGEYSQEVKKSCMQNAHLFESLCEMVMFLDIFGIKTLDGFRRSEFFWLNGLRESFLDTNGVIFDKKQRLIFWQSLEELFKNLKGWVPPENFGMEFLIEQEQLFTEVNYIKLRLEDNSEVVFDAQLASLWGDRLERKLPSAFSWPISKTIAFLSTHFISNNESTIFYSFLNTGNFVNKLFQLNGIYENSPGKNVKEAVLYQDIDREIMSFSAIPSKRRTFMVGLWPWQQEFKQLFNDTPWAKEKPFYHSVLDKIISWSEALRDVCFKGASPFFLRAIVLWEERLPQLIILTNQKGLNAGEIVCNFMSRWTNLKECCLSVFLKEGTAQRKTAPEGFLRDCLGYFREEEQQPVPLRKIFLDMGKRLKERCQERFFEKIKNIDHFLSIENPEVLGVCKEYEKIFNLHLTIASLNKSDRETLQMVINRLNDEYVLGENGKSIFIKSQEI